MDAERWRLVQKIFHATLERPESARPFFLDRICADDSALRAEVASLLDADKGGHFRPARRNGAPIPLPMVFGHEGTGQSNWVGLW